MKTYTVTLNNIDIEITQDDDGKFIKPTLVTSLESMGTAMKPAHEPCVLARKPLDGTVANNVLKHGTGGLNIDGSRIPTSELKEQKAKGSNGGEAYGDYNLDAIYTPSSQGRFPSNLIHDGSDEVEAVFPNNNSRFFYSSKSSKSERNAGLEGFAIKDPDSRSDTAKGSYTSKGIAPQSNHHPTVKPLSLTKYLATLIKPPTGGRLLVPFSGSGSEMIGALQAGWEYVEGVELTEEYIPIAEARIKYWLEQKAIEDKKLKQTELL